jgi:hypothetical protein
VEEDLSDSDESLDRYNNDKEDNQLEELNMEMEGNESDDTSISDQSSRSTRNEARVVSGSRTYGGRQTNNIVSEQSPETTSMLGDNDDLADLEEKLVKSTVVKKMLENQKNIFEQLELIATQQTGHSVFSSTKYVSVVELSLEQKSSLSHFVRSKFFKIKFLRDDEWVQLEKMLIEPMLKIISVNIETDGSAYTNIVKSYATFCIN